MQAERALTAWLVGLAFICAAGYWSVRVGIAWHGVSHEMPGVTVIMKNGRSHEGTLTRTWQGVNVLTTEDGRVTEFVDSDYESMSWSASPKAVTLPWRLTLPFMLISLCASVWMMWPYWRGARRDIEVAP